MLLLLSSSGGGNPRVNREWVQHSFHIIKHRKRNCFAFVETGVGASSKQNIFRQAGYTRVSQTCLFLHPPPQTCPLAGRLRAQPRGGERPTPQACTEANGYPRPFRGFLGAPIEAAMAAPPAPDLACVAAHGTAHHHCTQPALGQCDYACGRVCALRVASATPHARQSIADPTPLRHTTPTSLLLTVPHRLDRCPRRQTRPRSQRRTITRFPTRRGYATMRTESACR